MLDRFAYNYYNSSGTPVNVLDVIKTMPLGKTSVLRIGGITSGTPYGDNINSDIIYVVFRLPERDDFLRVIAHDVRANVSFENSLIGNTWNLWQRLLNNKYETITTQVTTDANGNFYTGLMGNYEVLWIRSLTANLDTQMLYSKNGVGQWWCKPISWANTWYIFANTTFDIEIAYRSL